MAGIYIHVPFCKSRCVYCDFYSSTDTSQLDLFVDAVCYELFIRKHEATFSINTIYLGGGTPSLLNNQQLEKIFNNLHANYALSELKEVTIEVNPDDLTKEKILFYKQLGINRISIGVQSFEDSILKILSRRHNAKQTKDAILWSYGVGIKNISIDLIYGINGLTDIMWLNTLQTTLKLPIKHISAYHLTIEEATPLYLKRIKNEYLPINEEESVKQYKIICDTLKDANYEHYEISNFSLKGYISKHNSSYWNFEPYIGVGPSAHSYNKYIRRWNIDSLEQYIKKIFCGNSYYKEEYLSNKDRFNEYIMVKLRTNEGLLLNELKSIDEQLYSNFISIVEKIKFKNMLFESNNRLFINENQWIISDYVIRELFV